MSNDKFTRNYKLRIAREGASILTIGPPFTLDFSVQRNTLSSANIASLNIYNLSEKNRTLLRKDEYNFAQREQVELLAGYGEDLKLILSADVRRGSSVRRGTDFITTLECYDGGFAFNNARINKTFQKNMLKKDVTNDMIKGLKEYGIERGAVGEIKGDLKRGFAANGHPLTLISEIAGKASYVDNQKIYVLGDDEVIKGPTGTMIINSDSGLLGTPTRDTSFLRFETIFEPSLVVGQSLSLKSVSHKTYDGYYKVVSVSHSGIISASTSGSVTTSVGLAYGAEIFNTITASGV